MERSANLKLPAVPQDNPQSLRRDELRNAVEQWATPRLLVVGDLMLDRYTTGAVTRLCPEAPVPIISSPLQETRLGGAGGVAFFLRELGCDVEVVGIIGDDADGAQLLHRLGSHDIEHRLVVRDTERVTTSKHRFQGLSAGGAPQQIVRVDRETRWALSARMQEELLSGLPPAIQRSDAILISDYGKGVCGPLLLEAVVARARGAHLPVLADPCQHAPLDNYRGVNGLTPNRVETARLLGRRLNRVADIPAAAQELRQRLQLDASVITLDEDGLFLSSEACQEHFSAATRQALDVTGAGDLVLAVLGICLAHGQAWDVGAELANLAAGLSVQRSGVREISRTLLIQQLATATPMTLGVR